MKMKPMADACMVESPVIKAKRRKADDLTDIKKENYAEGGHVGMEYGKKAEADARPADPAGMMADDEEMSPSKKRIMADHMQALKKITPAVERITNKPDMPEMAKGGMIKPQNMSRPDKGFGAIIAKDDMDDQPEGEEMKDKKASLAAILMSMKKAKKMADGGMVDIDENNEEQPNMYDEQNEEALDWDMDSQMADFPQPENSNEHGMDMDNADHEEDLVAAIRRHMRKKSPMDR